MMLNNLLKLSDQTQISLETDGYIVIKDFITQSLTNSLALSFSMLRDGSHSSNGISIDDITAFGDKRVSRSYSVSADPLFENLLEKMTTKVESITCKKLFPTYSYARIYYNGASLWKHSDRPSCEYSVTLCLSNDSVDWPICIIDMNGVEQRITQKPGDAIIYKGCELMHWRDEFCGTSHSQVFLHYVDQNGKYAEYAYDKRCGLNTGLQKTLDNKKNC